MSLKTISNSNFNEHYNLAGKHAILGASNYYWLNYEDDKIANFYHSKLAAIRGTELHEFAQTCIKLGQKLPRSKRTLNMYVNDAIGYRMKPEQVLYYSDNCFGTADSISFKNKVLRIHDLKTGVTPAKIDQVLIYAAIFCLEYGLEPMDIEMDLRIYQSDEILFWDTEPRDIREIMGRIIAADKIIEKEKNNERL